MKRISLLVTYTFLLISTLTGCAHQRHFRYPASESSSCTTLLGEVFDATSDSHKALSDLDTLEESVASVEGKVALEEYLADIREKILIYNNDELTSQWGQMMSTFQYYKSVGTDQMNELSGNWVTVKEDFFKKWRALEKSADPVDIEVEEQLANVASDITKELDELSPEQLMEIQLKMSFVQDVWTRGQSATHSADKEELKDFTYWLLSQKTFELVDNMNDSVNGMLSQYRQLVGSMSKQTRKDYITEGKKNILTLQNHLVNVGLDDVSNPVELKKQTVAYIELFSLLEDKFEKNRFLAYLRKNDFFSDASIDRYKNIKSAESIDINLGMMLREQYQKFAPFQDLPPVIEQSFVEKTVERTRGLWDKLIKSQKTCQDLDCYNKKATSSWLDFFKMNKYKEKFSCIAHNPVALKSMAMDLALVWGGITWYYSSDPDNFQRFPYEVMINGAVFAPIMAEANCRSTFKGNLSFGTVVPESEALPSLATKTARFFKKARGVAFKGFLSSAGLLGMTTGIDHLFLAMGHSIATPLSLNDMAALLPISFLYHGVWLSVKNLGVVNPIRHKIIPKLANKFAERTGLKSSYWPLQTGLDFGAFMALSEYGRWDYMIFYTSILMPFVQQNFTAGTDLEHTESLKEDGSVTHTFIGKSEESGVTTEVVITEDKSEGTVKLESVDMDVPEDTLDSWADQVLSGVPQD